MTDKAKPPQPMAFKNLAELKRYIKLGTEFKATRHKYHPDIVGLTRVVTKVQTNGFYSKIKNEPNHRFSDCNGGKGFFTELGKAGGYIFDGTAVKVLDKRGENGVIYELEFYRENTEVVALRTKCKKFAHKTQKGEESDSSGILAFFAYYYEMLRSRLV